MNRLQSYQAVFIITAIVSLFVGFSAPSQEETIKQMDSDKSSEEEPIVEVQSFYEAGDEIIMKSSNELDDSTYIHISSSYGTTIISSEINNGSSSFVLPNFISNKSGMVTWKLFQEQEVIDSGNFQIIPSEKLEPIIESYLGPPSIVAGGEDFTMMVITATDHLDNLLPNGTEVSIKNQFKEKNELTTVHSKDRIAWTRIFSPNESGRISIAGTMVNSSTKELIADVFPNNATNFTISKQLIHPYADGNQIATFETSEILDRYGNRVADGTQIDFIIKASDSSQLKTSGNTIRGVASAKLLHPNTAINWNIQAFVSGIANSDPIEVKFEPIIEDFKVLFSKNNRTITVGPIKSYMHQIVPDGIEVNLLLDSLEPAMKGTSENGYVKFNILEDYFPDGKHTLKLETMGITKTFIKELD